MASSLQLITFDPAVLPVAVAREFCTFQYPTGRRQGEYTAAQERYEGLSRFIYHWGEIDREPTHGDTQWICQISHMSGGDHVPRAAAHIERLYARHNAVVQLTPATIAAIMPAFNLKHDSYYERVARERKRRRWSQVGVARAREVKQFLHAHVGLYSFLDTW